MLTIGLMKDASGSPSNLDQRSVSPIGNLDGGDVKGKKLITIGAIGTIFLGVGAMSFIVQSGYCFLGFSFPIDMIVSSIIVCLGMLIHSFAHLGYYLHHKSAMGMATFIFSGIASVLFLVAMILSVQEESWSSYGIYMDIGYVWIGLLILGVGTVIVGVSHILARMFLASSLVFAVSGVMYIVSGSLIMSLLLAFLVPVGWVFLFTAAIMSTTGLFLALPHLGESSISKSTITTSTSTPTSPRIDRKAMKFCPDCGGKVNGFSFCPYCGIRLYR